MLIQCPECKNTISNKAAFCPQCGYTITQPVVRQTTRRLKLPNGFGGITHIKSQNLRNPYMVRITVGRDERGRCIMKLLKPKAYFKTYNEAYQALVEFHANPFDLDDCITTKELYERWCEIYFQKLSKSSYTNIRNAWSYCSSVYDIPARNLRARHIKYCIENGEKILSDGTKRKTGEREKKRIKSLFNNMLDYALEYELVDRNYARTFAIEIDESKRAYYHIPFTIDEINIIMNQEDKYSKMILIQCYSGLRPGELCDIETEKVNIKDGYFECGKKTIYSINRIVPIHHEIKEIVQKFYDDAIAQDKKYLFNNEQGNKISYHLYGQAFRKLITKLNLNPEHKPHDPRMTFITYAKISQLDDFALKRIVGHSYKNDITEAVYTKRPYNWLVSEMDKYHITDDLLTDQVL